MIKLEKDTLTIENPGSIRVGKYQMRLGGQFDPRNKALMKMFNLIGVGERAGSGVPELFSVWEMKVGLIQLLKKILILIVLF